MSIGDGYIWGECQDCGGHMYSKTGNYHCGCARQKHTPEVYRIRKGTSQPGGWYWRFGLNYPTGPFPDRESAELDAAAVADRIATEEADRG